MLTNFLRFPTTCPEVSDTEPVALIVTVFAPVTIFPDLKFKLFVIVIEVDKVVLPLLMESIKLPKVINVAEGNVLFAFITTVPVLGVQVAEPCPSAKEPVTNLELATIVIVPGLSSPLVDWVKMIDPASNVEPLTKVMVPPLFEFVLPLPPTVTAFVTVSLGLPDDAKVNVALVWADVPPNCKLAHTALVIFTVTDKFALLDPFAVSTTLSELVGKVLLFQLLASPQLEVPAPPSQVFWA